MRSRSLALGVGLVAIGLVAIGLVAAGLVPARSTAAAAVSASQFPPRTVADLIAICAPARDDPLMTAAVNFCQGFVEGAVDVEEAHAARPGARRLFCLPTPRPPRGSELTRFIAWANTRPARLEMPAIDGVFIYLARKYPCPATTPGNGRQP